MNEEGSLMRKLRRAPVAAGVTLLVFGLAGCNRGDDRADTMAADTAASAESADEMQEMLAPVRGVGLIVVEYAQLAARQATRPDVREFAHTVAADHRALIGVLDSVARLRGATLHETQTARELAHTARMAHSGLETMAEDAFDLSFIRAQVETHRQLLDSLDSETIPAARSNEMTALLRDLRVTVDAHLTRSRQLLGALLGEPVEPPPPAATPPSTPPATRPPAQQPPPPPPDTIPGR
jgi:putative membrane protein